MPHACGSVTQTGGTCNRKVRVEGTHCSMHQVSDEQCSVCLTELNGPTRKLGCGHTFHRRCILSWKNRGNHTCPMCRAPFTTPIPTYKITVIVENIRTQQRIGHTSVSYTHLTLPTNREV